MGFVKQLLVEDAKMEALANEMRTTHGEQSVNNAVLMVKQFRRMVLDAILNSKDHILFNYNANITFMLILTNWAINNHIAITEKDGYWKWRLLP